MKFAELSTLPAYFKWKYMHVPERFKIRSYLVDKLSVYDFDNSGESVSFWVIQSSEGTSFYRCLHEWYARWECDEWNPENSFDIKEVSKEEMLAEDHYGYMKQNLIYVV